MSETLALALVTATTGFVGALIGAWSMASLQRREHKRHGQAIRQAVLLDIVRWRGVYQAASEWRVTLSPGSGLRWWDVAGDLALHLPAGLYVAVAYLYVDREHLERAYAQLSGDGIPPGEVRSARFGFRRWTMTADEVTQLWSNYYNARKLARAVRRVERHHLEAGGHEITEGILSSVARRLRTEISYEVDDTADLISDLNRSKEYQEAMDEKLSSESEDTDDGDTAVP